MAKNFGNAGSANTIKAVAQANNEKANIVTIKMISDENLFDYKKNNENITYTSDLELSMGKLGFTDPIEATDFGMEDGNYTILSGHRRRMAGRKVGIKTFPVILRHFNTELEVYNYVLFANSQRDSARDPLLFCMRYKMHEEYLKESDFKGSFREEIANRLGISPQQADRYNQFNKIIFPVWDMVRNEKVGMSSVLLMASHTEEEQQEILKMLNEALENKQDLTRELCNKLIKGYREGKRSYLEVIQIEMVDYTKHQQAGVSIINVNTEPLETKKEEPSPLNRNNEINYDYSHREDILNNSDPYANESLTDEDKQALELAKQSNERIKDEKQKNQSNAPLTEEEKKLLTGEKISQSLSKIDGLFNEFYTFENKDKAKAVMLTMGTIIKVMAAEMENIADKYDVMDNFIKSINDVLKDINKFAKPNDNSASEKN